MPVQSTKKPEVEDSASAPPARETAGNDIPKSRAKAKGKGKFSGKNVNLPKDSNASTNAGEQPRTNSHTPGFAEGNSILQSYGLSVSGRRERILSAFKTDKFFHIVSDSWRALVDTKPHIEQRFSYAEFRHATALQLYSRLEQVKFDSLGIKPSAPTRIPLPRNTRVFQPLWSVLANIGRVDDDDLRVTYIPDGILPHSDDLSDPRDVENLLSCTLYDWETSWREVLSARKLRRPYSERTGVSASESSNETTPSRSELIQLIADKRKVLSNARKRVEDGTAIEEDGGHYIVKKRSDGSTPTKKEILATTKYQTISEHEEALSKLYLQAKNKKEQLITPKYDVVQHISEYRISDGSISADAGAYGQRLHWDPQLWLEYEQFVEDVSPVAMFSLSMPVETTGTYAWVVPTESVNEVDVFCKLPKASIAPVTWILALILQSSTLPLAQRSTFYVETDRLSNVMGLRTRYVHSAIKRGAPIEQYGTY